MMVWKMYGYCGLLVFRGVFETTTIWCISLSRTGGSRSSRANWEGFLMWPCQGNQQLAMNVPPLSSTKNMRILELQTTIFYGMFGEKNIFHVKIWNHPIETTIKKWMFQVPGLTSFDAPVWVMHSKPPPHESKPWINQCKIQRSIEVQNAKRSILRTNQCDKLS